MSYLSEVELALKEIYPWNKDLVLLQCTANYPIRDHEANLNVLNTFKKHFVVLLGYSDHTTGTGSGYYLYIEPSTQCFSKLASLSTPCIDLTNGINPEMTLWYHAFGADIGSFHVDLLTGSDLIMDVASPIKGNQGNEWKEMKIDLTPWIGKVVGMRFRGITSCNQKGDFAIDDFSVAEVITSVDDDINNSSDQFTIYPNPSNSQVTVTLNNAGRQNYNLHIVDMFGRVVYTKDIITTDNKILTMINVSHLVNGTYMLEMRSEAKTYQKKLSIR